MALTDDDVREVIAILDSSGAGELRIASGDFELHVVRARPGDPPPAPPPSAPPAA
jgi:hypothetical protein